MRPYPSARRCRTRRPRALAAATIAVAAVVALAGCSTPPWKQGNLTGSPSPSVSAGKSPSASRSASASGSPSATPSGKAVKNDLATGSISRTLTAGAVTFKVNYWSTLNMKFWTPEAASKPLNLSATASLADGAPSQGVFVSKVTVTPTVVGEEGDLTAPGPIVDEATTTPGYAVRRPQSYSSVFTIPQLDSQATSVSLTITYELLVQTKPKSTQYSKQTAIDTLSIVLASS